MLYLSLDFEKFENEQIGAGFRQINFLTCYFRSTARTMSSPQDIAIKIMSLKSYNIILQ